MAVDEAALDAFLADPTTPGGDLNPDGNAAAPAAPVAEAPAAQADTEVAIPAAETPLPEGETFPREYVEKLRRESASYRERAKKYNDVFEGYEPEAVDEWLSLATSLKSDPKAAAERFAELAEAIRGQFADPDGAAADAAVADAGLAPAEAAADAEKPLTRAEVDAILAERDRKAELDRRVAQIEIDARSLGYEPRTEGYDELLYIASTLPSGSIQEAHAKVQARKQAVIDAYVASLGQKPAPVVPNPNGGPASGEVKLRTFEEANSALDAWLANQA